MQTHFSNFQIGGNAKMFKSNIFYAKRAPYFHHMMVTFSIENSLQMINANDIQLYLYAKRENFYVSLL